jgi:hypothetical protein
MTNTDDPAPRTTDDVLSDYLRRLDAGEVVDRDELVGEHPQLAGELGAFFAAADLVEELAGPAGADDETSRPARTEHDAGAPDDRTPAPIRVFGRYELLEEIGRGGMGIVYKARQTGMERVVAVKVVQSGSFASETELRRFYAEARAAGHLKHPNIVNVHEVGDVDGRHFFSMDFVDGQDLRELCAEAPLEPRRAAEILRAVADAIHSAHEQGILHRDLKPANILIDADGRPHVTDFGLAKHLSDDSQITTTGTTVGTPSYMSPESARGEKVGAGADVYSLGAVLYAVLAGKPPFRGNTQMDTVLQVLGKEAEPLAGVAPGVPADLATIAHVCLEKDPAARYPSAAALAHDLARFLEGRPISARPVGTTRRALRWLREVPLIAGLSGRTHAHPTRWHRRAQWALLSALSATAIGLYAWLGPAGAKSLPDEILIAAAMEGGEYHRLSAALGNVLGALVQRPVRVLETPGSLENHALLVAGDASLALLQTGAIRPDDVAVIAPLYYDLVHVIVRRGSDIESVRDLAGRRVSLGLEGSGMLASALAVLRQFDVDPATLVEPRVHFTVLVDDPPGARAAEPYVAAIVTTGEMNEDLRRVLAGGDHVLLPLDDADCEALAGPIFRERTIRRGQYGDLPTENLRTVATTTFLAAEPRAADALVLGALESLYVESDLMTTFRLIPRESVSEWRMLDLHPAARRFFLAATGVRR